MKNLIVLTGAILLGSLLGNSLSAQPSIHLKSRTFDARRPRLAVSHLTRGGGHYILVFNSFPDHQTRQQLAERGIRILQYVPDTGLMVSMSASANLDGLDLAYTTALEAGDKISPELTASTSNHYLVIFHNDVEAAHLREVAQDAGFDIIDHPRMLPNQILAAGPFGRLNSLAARDEVAYILRASPELVSGAAVTGCPGAITEAGSVGEYVAAGPGWSKDSSGAVALKYVFQTLTQKMDPNVARGEIERALREWTKYANLTLTAGDRADAARTIAIRFATAAHGDGFPFDGPGKVLAHTFYPNPTSSEPVAGDMHLDADENWNAGANVDLFSVALHELGHALGLGHSGQPGAVMYPYYRQADALTADDITGIQSLYGTAFRPTQPALLPPSLQPGQPVFTAPVAPVAPVLPITPITPVSKDTTPPSIRLLSPGTTMVTTSSASISMVGTASDNVAVTAVKWTTSVGFAGNANGVGAWSANVPLLTGTNVIVVRAFDAAGNSAWRAVTIVRR